MRTGGLRVHRGLSLPALAFACASALAQAAGDDVERIAALRADAQAHAHGEGVARDPLRAFELYCEAARLGDAASQYDLGWIYANGRGVTRSDTLAASFFALAAAQGHPQAQRMLGVVGKDTAELPECMRDPVVAEYDDSPIFPPFETLGLDADTAFVATTPEEARVAKLVNSIAPEYQVNPLLALAVIRAESNFNPGARSPKNAQGLMQLIPETSARFNVKQPYDLVQNLRGGLAYLRWLLAYFEGNVPLVAAAYNAGERAVERYRGIPPYAETRAYVKRIMTVFRKPVHPFDARVTEPSPEMRRMRPVPAL